MSVLRIKILDVIDRDPRDKVPVGRSSKLVFTIWAVFGGFILHFLLCNWLTVLLTPSYEEPVETAKDLINRNITPLIGPGGEIYKQVFAASPDQNYREISRRFFIAKDWNEYDDMVHKVTSTGMYAVMSTLPPTWVVPEEEYKDWYRSTETIAGDWIEYSVHLSNKKWPLKKVVQSLFVIVKNYFLTF